MSSKKQQRRKRREERREGGAHRKRNPATLFILAIGTALVVVVLAGVFLRDGPGEPPFPGAVWSAQHGHWH